MVATVVLCVTFNVSLTIDAVFAALKFATRAMVPGFPDILKFVMPFGDFEGCNFDWKYRDSPANNHDRSSWLRDNFLRSNHGK